MLVWFVYNFFYLFDSVVVCFFIIIMFLFTFVWLFICICISIFENLQFIHLDWHLYWVCSFCFCFLCFNDNLFLTRPQKPLPRLMKKPNRKCIISVYIKFSLFLLMAVIWSFRHLTGEVNGQVVIFYFKFIISVKMKALFLPWFFCFPGMGDSYRYPHCVDKNEHLRRRDLWRPSSTEILLLRCWWFGCWS